MGRRKPTASISEEPDTETEPRVELLEEYWEELVHELGLLNNRKHYNRNYFSQY